MKIIAAGDFHFPAENKKALELFEKYLGQDSLDYLILGGDLIDFSYLSKYSIGNLRSIEGKRIVKDYDYANKYLDKFDKLARKIKKIFLVGNHDDRIRKYIDANPNLEGLLELPESLRLKERDYQVVYSYPEGEVFKIANLTFTHGNYTNQFHAKKHLENYDTSIVYFHTHTFQSFTKSRFDKRGIRTAQAVGCMCNYEQDYMGKKPSSWQTGFLIIEVDKVCTKFTSVMV